MAHIVAAAIQNLWPDAKFGVGPVVENGFYYDIDLGDNTISEDDFNKIDSEIKKIIAQDLPFEKNEMSIDDAIDWANESNQPYKKELLNDLKRSGTTSARDIDAEDLGVESGEESKISEVTFYTTGKFTDLCRGPHIKSTRQAGAFKLMKVAGAYWRGKESNPQMQRLYGVAFESQEELDRYLENIEEAKKRDHRKIGKELDLYSMSNLVGAGLPLFTPRGTLLRDKLGAYAEQVRRASKFQRVNIPHITKIDLYKVSGHWDKFGDELFLVQSQETSDKFALKPMNCPHHNQIFASQPRSYKELPVRYFETTTVYRDEKTGELGGLSRVRSITQDDSHVYCRNQQLEQEIGKMAEDIKEFYELLEMPLRARLSFRDEGATYLGDNEPWTLAQDIIKDLANKMKLNYFVAEGEAAFYGPKIDFMATDALGREHQVATIQLDFIMPERFKLEYTAEDGSMQRPVMLHCALLGSIERFLGVYIEHVAGWFPFWMAPEQLRIVTVNDAVQDYVEEIRSELDNVVLMKPLKYNELRYGVDDRNESLGRKIRDAVEMKIPVIIVVGSKDKMTNEVSVRIKNKEEKLALKDLKEFLQHI